MANNFVEVKRAINQGTPLKTTPTDSPVTRLGSRLPHRSSPQPAFLSLRRIIGTTSSSSSGLACHYDSSSFAYCAGSAAVVAKVDEGGEISYRFFRAQPTASPLHPCTSFYHPTTPTASSESRRRTILPPKHGLDERSSIKSPRRIWGDEGSPKAWSARERVKAVSCVDLSSDGRLLAVGESGYSPRVNIFSTFAGTAADVPLTIITEHSFGVRCVAFSPNSRWLATLGDANDGFLFIWSINPKTGAARLHFANKCTADVLGMAWCGNNLITVGTRYVKVWRVGEPSPVIQMKSGRMMVEGDRSPAPKTLSGRNSLLGCLADSIFTCVASISESEAILCTKTGIVCLLDDHTGNQELKYIRQLSFPTMSVAVDHLGKRTWFVSRDGDIVSENFESIRNAGGTHLVTGSNSRGESMATSRHSSQGSARPLRVFQWPRRSSSPGRKRRGDIIASTCLPGRIVSIDEARNIRLECMEPADSERPSVVTLPAHNEAVQGVICLSLRAGLGDYVTWSSAGAVNFWSIDGSLRRSEKVDLEQPEQLSTDLDEYVNELKHVRLSEASQAIVVGDRLGVLQVIRYQCWESIKVRAHSAEITDIALDASEQWLLVATSSRDRTVQLLQHRGDEIELLQTFDDHVGAVNAVRFMEDFLLSASADRTVIVRQKLWRTDDDGTRLLAYIPKRVITLKASPMSIVCPDSDLLLVSTLDRKFLTFSISGGFVVDEFKASDADGEDAVTISSLCISSEKNSPGCPRILAGFSPTDKSIRLYDYDRGILLARELGHTEGISGIALLEYADDVDGQCRRSLFSTGLDGLVMVWDASTSLIHAPSTPLQELAQGQALAIDEVDDTPTRGSVLKRPALRKVLSKLDLAEIAGSAPSASLRHDQPPPHLVDQTSPRPAPPSAAGKGIKHNGLGVRKPLSGQSSGECSPSPRSVSTSLPATPKAVHRANKGRLRRPPSVPADLRGQSQAQSRRKSMGNIPEFGSTRMASEQLCRTLRAYRRKIDATPKSEPLQLDEVGVELQATLRAVEKRHVSKSMNTTSEKELDNLASLMQSSRID